MPSELTEENCSQDRRKIFNSYWRLMNIENTEYTLKKIVFHTAMSDLSHHLRRESHKFVRQEALCREIQLSTRSRGIEMREVLTKKFEFTFT